MSIRVRDIYIFGLLLGIYLLAWILQANILLNWDVSWLMHAAKRLLAGGSYAKDFFEINPPMILYLYIPPILLAKYAGINIIHALRIYIFLISIGSLMICYGLIKSIFIPNRLRSAKFFLLMLALVFLILPIYEFGQREQLLLMLSIPYFLLATNRLLGHAIKSSSAIAIGLFSGLGFALKPYFLLPLAMVELYYCLYNRNPFAWMRAELIAIFVLLVAYLISIFIFFPDYLYLVIPRVSHFYHDGVSLPINLVLSYRPAIFCLFAILYYFITFKNHSFDLLCSILMIALVGFFIAFLLQQTVWYYHILPAYSLAILLLFLLFSKKSDSLFMAVVAPFVFSFPVSYSYHLYQNSLIIRNTDNTFIAFMREHASYKSVYIFSTSPRSTFPIVDYAEAIPVSRIAFFGWMLGALRQTNDSSDNQHFKQGLSDKNFFIDMISDDLNSKKPYLVFIDVSEFKSNIQNIKFDYLNYFSNNQNFQKAWKAYNYLMTIENSYYYKYQIYQRK